MPTPILVQLTREEFVDAASVGLRRQVHSLYKGAQHLAFKPDDEYKTHVLGAVAEFAAATALHAQWPATVDADRRAPDLCGGWQVRWNGREDAPTLIVRHHDRDDQRFVLVTGFGPVFSVWGWMWGLRAKSPQWRRDPGQRGAPCWCVPAAALRALVRAV